MLVLVEKDSIEPWPVVSTIWVQAIEFDSYFGYYGLSLTLKTQQLMQYEAARDIAVEFNSVPGHHVFKHLALISPGLLVPIGAFWFHFSWAIGFPLPDLDLRLTREALACELS